MSCHYQRHFPVVYTHKQQPIKMIPIVGVVCLALSFGAVGKNPDFHQIVNAIEIITNVFIYICICSKNKNINVSVRIHQISK